jgi:hypothetical protein
MHTSNISLLPPPDPTATPYLDSVTVMRLVFILVIVYVLFGATLGVIAWFKLRKKGGD